MPNTKDTIKIINYALQSDNKKVIVLKGDWGIGKTYLWKEEIQLNIIHQKCGYVSLFGKSSIQEINKAALSAVYLVNKTSKITHKARQITSVVNSATENFAKINTAVQGIDALLSVLNRENLKNTIICFDDLERMDDNIKLKDFFGFVNELAEHQECKVILIFNENELFNIEKIENTKNTNNDKNNSDVIKISENQKIYNKFKEKTIDLEVTYTPEFEDNFNIACDITQHNLSDIHIAMIKEVFETIDENNIRIMSKCIEHVNDFINAYTKVKNDKEEYIEITREVLNSMIQSITYITQQYLKYGHKYWLREESNKLELFYAMNTDYDVKAQHEVAHFFYHGKYETLVGDYLCGIPCIYDTSIKNYITDIEDDIIYNHVKYKMKSYGDDYWNYPNGIKDDYINKMCDLFDNEENAYSFFINESDASFIRFIEDSSIFKFNEKFKEIFNKNMNKAIDKYIHEYQTNPNLKKDYDIIDKINYINPDKVKNIYKIPTNSSDYINIFITFIREEETEADKLYLEQIEQNLFYKLCHEDNDFFCHARNLFFEKDLHKLQSNIPHFLYIVAQYLLNTINENPDNEFKYNTLGKYHSNNNEYNAKQDIEDYIKEYKKQ